MVNSSFEFRDSYGRWTSVAPCWVTNPSGEGGQPAVQFRLACGECLQLPRGLVPDILAAVRDAAAVAGPDSPRAVPPKPVGGVVKGLPVVGQGGSCCTLPGPRDGARDVSGTCPGTAGDRGGAACPGDGQGLLWDTSGTACPVPCPGASPQAVVVGAGPDCGMILVRPAVSATGCDTAGTRHGHPGEELPARCESCGTGTHLMAGGSYAACARIAGAGSPEPEREGTAYRGWVRGRCPACRRRELVVDENGYVLCLARGCADTAAAAGALDADGWVRTGEALDAIRGADERVERLTSRALAVREYALTLDEPVRGQLLQLLTQGTAPDQGAAVPAGAAEPGEAL